MRIKPLAILLILVFSVTMAPPASAGLFDFMKKKMDFMKRKRGTSIEEHRGLTRPPAEVVPVYPAETFEPEGSPVYGDEGLSGEAEGEADGGSLEPGAGEYGGEDSGDGLYADELDDEYEADPDEHGPAPELEEILSRASTDLALLSLARAYAGKGEFAKAATAYQRLIEDFPASEFKYEAFYELGFLRYRKGRLREARLLLKYVTSSWRVDYELKSSARVLLDDIKSIYSRGKKRPRSVSIGVLLPFKLGYAKFGEAALKGVLLAAEAFGGAGLPVEVHVRDTGGDPEQTREAINNLVSGKKVRGIVGPLLSSVAEEAARSAQSKRVPMIMLSQKAGATDIGDYIFRSSLMPSVQAELVARYSYNVLGHRNFSILHPRNNYGTELARYFVAEIERLGGVIVSKVSYRPGILDFSAELVEAFGIEETERKEGRRTIREYEATLEVDALYIPEYYQSVSLIVPYIEYYNIDDVQLLGSNGWNTTKLIELNGKSVRGAVFVDGFFAGSGRGDTVRFVDSFRRVYGRTPGVLEAQAYDATVALLSVLAENDFKWMDWKAVRNGIREVRELDGATGGLSFAASGDALKTPFLLAIDGRRIVEIEVVEAEAAEPPEPPGGL
jgi:ABC-type branched-subunit amino acid transport system substrate-binding protein